MKHRGWIIFSGILWLVMGGSLLRKGLFFMSDGLYLPDSLCMRWKDLFGNPEQAGMAFVSFALLLGLIKGRFVLSKTVARTVSRIYALDLPISFSSVFPVSYFAIIALMMGFGVGIRFLPISMDARGFIDIAVGSALINGAMLYFRSLRKVPEASK